MQEQPRKRLLTVNDPHQMRIYKDLAVEIGFEESVVLLQLEFLIATNNNYRDGSYWTFQSHRKLQQNHFPWWHHTTIGRIINNLVEKKLLVVANYNKMPLDKTPWYALNEEGINQLTSVKLIAMPMEQKAPSTVQNAPSVLQNAPSAVQIAATIPEISEEKINKEKNKNIHVESDRLDGGLASASPTKKEIKATVERIFNYWVLVRKKDPERTKLTKGRQAKIEARLNENYTEEQIRLAIDGCNNSPFHTGNNDSGTVHDDLTLICRSGEKLEFFIEKAPVKKKQPQPTQPDKPKKTYAEVCAEIDAEERRKEQERLNGLRI